MPIRGILFVLLIAILIWAIFGEQIYNSIYSHFHKDSSNNKNDSDK